MTATGISTADGVGGRGEAVGLRSGGAVRARTRRIEATGGWAGLHLGELWEYRELLFFLIWRDVKVRYKQTALGVGWVVLQPLIATVIFTLIFGYLARIPSEDVPYPVFALAGLLPWTYFAGGISRSGMSLVANAQLVTKVYFPRLLIPLATVLFGLVDLCVSLIVLIPMMAVFEMSVRPSLLLAPFVVMLAVAATLGFSLWLAALNVRYRDVSQMLPFLVQAWMYATPVVYPATLIPERWRAVYALNPMVGVIEGFRWALIGLGPPPVTVLVVSAAVVMLVLASGVMYFRHIERTFADVV